MEKITPQQPEFRELCTGTGIKHPSTVHHFEKDAIGIWTPVFWSTIHAISGPLKERGKLE